MRRVFRHVFTLCSAASLVLCVAVCVVWVRSYDSPADWLERKVDGGAVLAVANGRLQVGRLGPSQPLAHLPPLSLKHLKSDRVVSELLPRQTAWHGIGFEEQRGRLIVFGEELPGSRIWDPQSEEPYRIWFIPLWFTGMLFAVLPTLWLTQFRVRRRRSLRLQQKLCPACGYDLRASPDRCPECGAAAAAAADGPRAGG